ncbi:CorA metal ion transporter [Kickxella alabastrina]|uniref:CorA metal ion transporter n=1 Tax=Kickxella alabastrina TaxID=61397 RepID=A0ACC1I9J8_9FUNG|nr:CorA metal ion transporter [Kickxella alabastrina]
MARRPGHAEPASRPSLPPPHPTVEPKPSLPRLNFDALRQWSDSGKVNHASTSHRRYRLGRWHSRTTSCSWNPPTSNHPQTPEQPMRPLSIDISHKPSESRRTSSIISSNSIWPMPNTPEEDSAYGGNGPLAQMLLRENDEIWNNPRYRFTFYSPATGTVRAKDVCNLRTDVADGLEALMRQATADTTAASQTESGEAESESAKNATVAEASEKLQSDRSPRTTNKLAPQLSVTSADSVPDVEQIVEETTAAAAAVSGMPDAELLHPNYARGAPKQHLRREFPRPPRINTSAQLEPAKSVPKLFWLDIMDPTDDDITALAQIFDLHPLTCEELMLVKEKGLAQDTYKSFRHYDIACYRTSAVYDTEPLPEALIPTALGSVLGENRSIKVASMRRRRSFLQSASENFGAVSHIAAAEEAEAEGPLTSWDQDDHLEVKSFDEKVHQSSDSLSKRLSALILRPQTGHAEITDETLPASLFPARITESLPEDDLDEPVPFYIIVLETGIVTLHCGNVPHVRNTVARLMLDEQMLSLTPDYIAYLLLDDITDTLVPTTRLLELEVDAIDELVLILTRAEHDDVLKRIGIERRHALWLVRLLHGKAEVLRSVERRTHAKSRALGGGGSGRRRESLDTFSSDESRRSNGNASLEMFDSQLLTSDEEEGDLYGWSRRTPRTKQGVSRTPGSTQPDVTKYLASVHDHLIALTASVHHCERILARAHGNYLARINLELTHASNTTNQLATQMTVLAGIFLPLNLVAGIFGMNVKVPGRDREDLRDFGIILGSMGAFIVIALIVCRWRRII